MTQNTYDARNFSSTDVVPTTLRTGKFSNADSGIIIHLRSELYQIWNCGKNSFGNSYRPFNSRHYKMYSNSGKIPTIPKIISWIIMKGTMPR